MSQITGSACASDVRRARGARAPTPTPSAGGAPGTRRRRQLEHLPVGASPPPREQQPRRVLVREPDHLVVAEVDPDHPLGEAGLERLLDHEPAAVKYGPQRSRNSSRGTCSAGSPSPCTAATRGPDRRARPSRRRLPPMPRCCFSTSGPRAEAARQLRRAAGQGAVRWVSALQLIRGRVDEHLLGRQPRDHVRVGADPDAGPGDLAQQRVERRAVEPLLDRVHPDEHAVEAEQLIAHQSTPRPCR